MTARRLSPEELAPIRARTELQLNVGAKPPCFLDREALLSHIEALEAELVAYGEERHGPDGSILGPWCGCDFWHCGHVAAVAERDRLRAEVERLRALLRCRITGNPCGTDTVRSGHGCRCEACVALFGERSGASPPAKEK